MVDPTEQIDIDLERYYEQIDGTTYCDCGCGALEDECRVSYWEERKMEEKYD